MYCPVCRADYPEDWKVCPKDETALLQSAQIGKYKIEGLLGVGGMGAVYRAINPDTRGRVAIKIMNPAVAGAESARARFQREAAAVAALRTAHVVKVFDFGTDAGTLYLVMELLDGHTLREEIQAPPETMELARVQMVLDGALRGLAAAHKAGIVHRDLKPENVYVTETDDGEVPKLLDFGIARVRTKDSDLTLTGSLMGTAGYMAIEQVAPDHGEIGPWTDVYAMGAILYELLAGTAACGGETVTSVLQKVLRHDIVPLATLRPGLPAAIYTLVERCLDVDPVRRPQDADAMRAELAAAKLVPAGTAVPPPRITLKIGASQVGLLATAPSKDTLPSKPPTVVDPQPPRRKSQRTVALVVGFGVIVGLTYLGSTWMHRHRAATPPDAALPRDAAAPLSAVDAISIDVASANDSALPAGPLLPADMLRIPAGEYALGEPAGTHPDALAPTKLTLSELWIDRRELPLELLRSVLRDPKAGGLPGDASDLPARNVTWAVAAAACKALGRRLPTELEWEAAALVAAEDRAVASLLRGKARLTASTPKACSAAGLCDMLGSVLEWTADDGPRPGTKIARGASFTVSPDAGWQASIHFRVAVTASKGDPEVGVRCVSGPGHEP
ncbi:MAG: protein kinase [Myxococcales bacterium]|nr:protein kinase [Myxococcales bacterium]